MPSVLYFKPAGIRSRDLEEVLLRHDEVEAMRLKDVVGLSQEEAAKEMNVSQPTFHRLINAAHKKSADVVVHGKSLLIEGGDVSLETAQLPPCGRLRQRCRQEPDGGPSTKVPGGDGCGATGNGNDSSKQGGTMKIAITSVDGTMEGPLDERFGRCRKLVLYDPETKSFEVMDNTVSMSSPQGAGIQTSQNVINSGAKAVISGHLGPNAYRVLKAADIDIFTASGVTVSEAIKAFEEGRLPRLDGPDVAGHW